MIQRTLPAVILGVATAMSIAACGGGGSGGQPDARPHVDAAPPDAPSDPCDYHEAADATNNQTPEATGLTLANAEIRICGQIDAKAPTNNSVDLDAFTFTSSGTGHFLVRLVAPNGNQIGAIVSGVQDTMAMPNVIGSGVYVGNHLVYVADLGADTYAVTVEGLDTTQPAAAIPYEIRIAPDTPDTRCVAPATTNYTEQRDIAATNVENDMVNVNYGPPFTTTQTTNTQDAPEPAATAVTVSPATSYRIDGTAGVNAAEALDAYRDKDTYLIATGANTNQLDIRLEWTANSNADLDFYLFPIPQGAADPVNIASGTTIGADIAEFQSTAVLPSTSYWVWVGNYDPGPDGIQYHLTICGSTFTP